MATIREMIRKDGTRSYHAEVRLRGHPPQRASFRTRSLAKKWVQDVESGIRDGRHFKTVESKRHTVEEMINKFTSQWLPKYPHRQAKQTALLDWWKEKCGHLLLADFTSSVIAEHRDLLLSEITSRGKLRSPSTANRYLSALGKALTIAMKEWGWLEDSPMRKVTKPPEGDGRERFLSIEERNCLLSECRKSRNLNLFPMVALALASGMRLGELAGLRWRDIDFERNLITLLKTKNGDARYLPLTREMKIILKNCHTFGASLEEFVFQSKKRAFESQAVSIREAFEAALKRAEIKDFRFHDLRHTAASYMAMGGATQGELMAILGHRTPAMTRRYAHYSQKHLAAVLEKLTLGLKNETDENLENLSEKV